MCVLVRCRDGAHLYFGTSDLFHEVSIDWKRRNDLDGIRLPGSLSGQQPQGRERGDRFQHLAVPLNTFRVYADPSRT